MANTSHGVFDLTFTNQSTLFTFVQPQSFESNGPPVSISLELSTPFPIATLGVSFLIYFRGVLLHGNVGKLCTLAFSQSKKRKVFVTWLPRRGPAISLLQAFR